jgi:hypothetical protein
VRGKRSNVNNNYIKNNSTFFPKIKKHKTTDVVIIQLVKGRF